LQTDTLTNPQFTGLDPSYFRRSEAPPEVSVPVGFTTFPGEILRTSRSWAERSYPNLTYFNEVDRGGHLAAWEEPQLFSAEVRAAFKALR
jgi:hypothetical protein